MPAKLSQGVADKMKAEFPALNINQLAAKYGVSWATARQIVNPMKDPPAPKAARRRAAHIDVGEVSMETVVNA